MSICQVRNTLILVKLVMKLITKDIIEKQLGVFRKTDLKTLSILHSLLLHIFNETFLTNQCKQ